MGILKKFQEMKQEMTRWRQRLHAEPELAFEENKTSRFLLRQLKSFGIDDVHVMAKTGLVAVLHGRNGPGGKGIMLRADMDALPITENTGVLHASRNPGVHHACGHDGHMAMLLGAAKHLAETKDFDGTVYIVFQPAEEHIGGANEMIKEGIFSKFQIDEVYGMHNFPGLPLGAMATVSGPMLAASDEFEIVMTGTGGHSARAENTNDVLGAAAEAIMKIKDMAKKTIGKDDVAALTLCSLHTKGEASNVLADEARFNGSIRTFSPELHEKLQDEIDKILVEMEDKYGVVVTIEYKNGYPMLENTKKETDFALDVARETVGPQAVITPIPPTLGTEDFAYFLKHKPGNYIALGTGNPAAKTQPDIHSAKYDFNDAALPIGASYWVNLVERALPLLSNTPPANDDNGAAPKGAAPGAPKP
jgi:hippurate hydrolase